MGDAASGSGHNSVALLKRFPKAVVTGFDISSSACEAYRHNVGRPGIQADLTKPLDHPGRFDAAMVVGGLHHCVVDLPAAVDNLANMPYFLISQSLLSRIPKPVKRAITPPLMVVEHSFNRLPMSWVHPCFIARWVRI